MRRARAIALWLAVGLLAAPAAGADLRQVESVGVAAIRPADTRGEPPRDAALRAAVARGVEGVAQSMLPSGWDEAIPPPRSAGSANDLDARLAPVLGTDPFEYATRFRILEDRGVRAALFTQDPEIENEYVVVVEVYVDAGRLRERFQDAGWVDAPAGRANGSAVRIVLQDLTSFGAYDALRRTLLDELGVDSAIPVELTRGRAVLAVEGPYDAAGLQQALIRHGEEGLRVVPLAREGQTLTLLVDYVPPPAAPAPDEDAAASGSAPTH